MSDLAAPAHRRGTLIVLSAPSGTGKTTLVQRLKLSFPDLAVSISTTTRAPRRGERDGVHYRFATREAFVARIAEGAFLEHAEVHGQLYGTLREPVDAELAAGRDVLLEIDVQGASQVRRSDPAARLVFLLPPSHAELERRLRSRGTDAPEAVERRLRDAAREVSRALDYDHVVVNDDLETALGQLVGIVTSYRQSIRAQRAVVERVQSTFNLPPAGAS